MPNFSAPCDECTMGHHDSCTQGVCGCIAPHGDDDPIMRGFKARKRRLHPERESWTFGGWNTER